MRPDQYVGVTGFCRRVEVEYFLRALPPHCEIKAMVGVLMSFNSEGSHVQKYPLRYPNHSDIADLFVDHPQVLNLVHLQADRVKSLLGNMSAAYELAGSHCDGLQLNICWPDVRAIRAFRAKYAARNPKIVLQCGRKALEQIDGSPALLVDMLMPYSSVIDYVLIDQSAGRGHELDATFVATVFRAIRMMYPQMGLVAAGGLVPSDLGVLDELVREFPDVSLDIESGVRNTDDAMVVSKAQEFLLRSLTLLQERKRAA